MHSRNIAKSKDGRTPQSCVSCHEKLYSERKECAGCHNIVKPTMSDEWCAVCHADIPSMTREQWVEGMQGKLDPEENAALAANAIATKTPHEYLDGKRTRYRVIIDELAKTYAPNIFNHARHIVSLQKKVATDPLANAFHSSSQILCQTCHHHEPATSRPSKCVSCHTPTIDKAHPGRPQLKAAYHLQCMGCHDGMDVKRPRNTDCTACHKLRTAQQEESK